MIELHTNEMDINCEKAVKVCIYDNFEQLESIQQRWDDFVESSSSDIFLTYDWCRVWWKYYGTGRRLQVFLFFDDNDKLVGIIPLFFEKIWLGPVFVRAAKIVSSDFTGDQITIPVLGDYIKLVLQRFFESLAGEKWDILHIGPIAGLYEHYDDLKNACEEIIGNSHRILSEEKSVQTYFKLGGDWETYLSSLSKRDRGDINRNYRYIARTINDASAQVLSMFADASNVEETFNEFAEMHQKYWIKLGKGGHFGDWLDARKFHFEAAKAQLQKNRLRLLKVMIKEYCLGYEYNYKFGETFFQLLNARSDIEQFKNISMGKIVFGELVKRALDEKIRYIDSMKGKYEYKLRLGGKLFPIRSLYVVPRKLSAMVRVFVFRFMVRILTIVYIKIWFRRVVPWLKLKPRPLWKSWIRSRL